MAERRPSLRQIAGPDAAQQVVNRLLAKVKGIAFQARPKWRTRLMRWTTEMLKPALLLRAVADRFRCRKTRCPCRSSGASPIRHLRKRSFARLRQSSGGIAQ